MKSFASRHLVLASALAFAPISFYAFAQDAPPPSAAQAQQDDATAPQAGDRMLKMYAKKLSLSADQQAQLKPIIEDRQQQLISLRNDTSLRGMQKMRKMRSIRDDSDKKINAILNDDQKKQYAQLEEEQMQKMKDRRQSRRGGAALNQ